MYPFLIRVQPRAEGRGAMTALVLLLVFAFVIVFGPGQCFAQAQTCAYVVRRGEEPDTGALVVLETDGNTVTAAIPAGDPESIPKHIALAPDGRRAFVTFESETGDGVTIIDTATNSVLDIVRGDFGCGVAVSPDSAIVYAGNETSNLAVIDAATGDVVDEIPSAGGCGIQVSQNGSTVFVLDDDEVKVIDAEKRTIARSIPLRLSSASATARGLSLPPGNLLYAGDDGGVVYVIEIPNNAVAVGIPTACPRSGGFLSDIAATPNGRLVYATHVYEAGNGCITVINASSQRSSLLIPVSAGATAVATRPDNALAYVGTGGAESIALQVIDVATSTIVDTLPLPGCGDGVARCEIPDIAIGSAPEGCSFSAPTPTIPTPTPTETRTPVPTSTPAPCVGDCNDDGRVGLDEVVRAVGIALVTRPSADCPPADVDGDGTVRIDDLVRMTNAAIVGCIANEAVEQR